MTIMRLSTFVLPALLLAPPLAAQEPSPSRAPEPPFRVQAPSAVPSPQPPPASRPSPEAPPRPAALPFPEPLVALQAPEPAAMPFAFVEPPHVAPGVFHLEPGSFYQGPFVVAHTDASGRMYQQARGAIEQNRYDRALELLDQVIAENGSQSDAATYWKAYSQARVGRRADALATIANLQKQFPKSRWLNDARALDVEIRQAAGQDVSADALANEELKLLALRGLMRNNAESVLPTIEGILSGTSSPRVKDQALFVLSQNRTPRTRSIILGFAKGSSNPELQLRAIRYLGMMGGPEAGDTLDDIYRSAADADVKRAILRSYAAAGVRDKLLALAKSEPSVDLRAEAVQQLGALRAVTELVDLYRTDQAPEVKRAAINALAGQRNAAALVGLARAEKDLELKKAIVSRLSTMQAPEARDYMMELLK
jgi:HEAT repeat protein